MPTEKHTIHNMLPRMRQAWIDNKIAAQHNALWCAYQYNGLGIPEIPADCRCIIGAGLRPDFHPDNGPIKTTVYVYPEEFDLSVEEITTLRNLQFLHDKACLGDARDNAPELADLKHQFNLVLTTYGLEPVP
jgi:hypothetical protein